MIMHSAFRRRHRMNKDAFWRLLDSLEGKMGKAGENRKYSATPNGNLTKASWLSTAMRYFSGGNPLNISELHGVSNDEGGNSRWELVHAIHECPELDIKFPETYNT
jgi:hypothetical protein